MVHKRCLDKNAADKGPATKQQNLCDGGGKSNVIYYVESDDDIPCTSVSGDCNLKVEEDFNDSMETIRKEDVNKGADVNVEDESAYETGWKGLWWDMCDSNERLVKALVDERGDDNPPSSLVSSEMKDETLKEEVKIEDDDWFGEDSNTEMKECLPEALGNSLSLQAGAKIQDRHISLESEKNLGVKGLGLVSECSPQPSTSGTLEVQSLKEGRSKGSRSDVRKKDTPLNPITPLTVSATFQPQYQTDENNSYVNKYQNEKTGIKTDAEGSTSVKRPANAENLIIDKFKLQDVSDIVQILVETNFLVSNRIEELENMVIHAGRPSPLMELHFWNYIECREADNHVLCYHITRRVYEEIPWLTGSKKLEKYFCWPCLLYIRGQWSFLGSTSKEEFWNAIQKHQADPFHRLAFETLRLREKKLKSSKNIAPNHNVRINRQLMTHLIGILCSKNIKPNNAFINPAVFMKPLKEAISKEPQQEEYFMEQLGEEGLRLYVQHNTANVLKSILARVFSINSKEITNTPFVSIIYEDTSSVVDGNSQLAVILRFVTKYGDVHERLMKFVNIKLSRTALDVFRIHSKIVRELEIRHKLVGFTFSGTVVDPMCLVAFSKLVQEASPRAKFFHHPDHNFKELLLQSLSHVGECHRFLGAIAELVTFLISNSEASATLVTFISSMMPNLDLDVKSSFTFVNIIPLIRRSYECIIKFFKTHAPRFMRFLQEPFNIFLINAISAVLDIVEDLTIVVEREFDLGHWRTKSIKTQDILSTLQASGINFFKHKWTPNGMIKFYNDVHDDLSRILCFGYCDMTMTNIVATVEKVILYRVKKAETFYVNSFFNTVPEILVDRENWSRYGLVFETRSDYLKHLRFYRTCNILCTTRTIPEIIKALADLEVAPQFLKWPSFLRFCALAMAPTKSTPSNPSILLRLKSYLNSTGDSNPTNIIMFLEDDLLDSLLKTSKSIDDIINQPAK